MHIFWLKELNAACWQLGTLTAASLSTSHPQRCTGTPFLIHDTLWYSTLGKVLLGPPLEQNQPKQSGNFGAFKWHRPDGSALFLCSSVFFRSCTLMNSCRHSPAHTCLLNTSCVHFILYAILQSNFRLLPLSRPQIPLSLRELSSSGPGICETECLIFLACFTICSRWHWSVNNWPFTGPKH